MTDTEDLQESASTITATDVAAWVQAHPLVPAEVDCAIAVMLKILDGKCRMDEEEKRVMALLYDAVREQCGQLLGDDMHGLIAQATQAADEVLRAFIYEKRVLAETMISRPVMKAFKARIRQEGLFGASASRLAA